MTPATKRPAEETTPADETAGATIIDTPTTDEWESPETPAGPGVIDGPFGTTVDSADERLGSLRVKVNSNVMLGNEVRTVGETVTVPDDAETRGAIAVGHVSLLDGDDEGEDESV